ncbi:enolase C-terminal domain-like protein [Cupriavidus necator]
MAAGENHYTRYEFNSLFDSGTVTIMQPDLSKTGGVTETLRIAMAAAQKLPMHLHTSMSGINTAAPIHVLAAIENRGYFEADVSRVRAPLSRWRRSWSAPVRRPAERSPRAPASNWRRAIAPGA